MRFIHTADWQIGKPFKYFGEKETILRHARLKAIETIGHAAEGHGVRHVLLAGDMYDTESPAEKTLSEPLARMQQFTGVTWHVISGNHDPHRANGLWDRVRRLGVPANIRLHLDEGPVDIEPGVALMPAPLRRKSEVKDLTEWMAAASSPAGTIRIGLAHGSITGFGSANEAGNPIAPDRAQQAGLDYLALGDWHRTMAGKPKNLVCGNP